MGFGNVEDNQVVLLGVNLSSKPRWLQLLICGGLFFVGYMVNGVCEEYVYNTLHFRLVLPACFLFSIASPTCYDECVYTCKGCLVWSWARHGLYTNCSSSPDPESKYRDPNYGWYFTLVQSLVFLALMGIYGFKVKHILNPWRTYIKLSAVLMGSQGLTKGSLMWLNYPSQLMFKSTKVLPVMVIGAFIPGLRRKYALHEYFSAVMLVIGLVIFTLADANTSPNFNVAGVVMVCGALVLDSFMGNLQEAIFTQNPATSQMEMLFCSTLVGIPFLIPPMILTGEIFTAFTACANNYFVYVVLLCAAVSTFIGQLSVLCLIALFGAATTAMVTTARKALTLLLSYIIFTKPLTGQHGSGLLLIAMAIVLKMVPDPFPKIYQALGRNEPKYAQLVEPLEEKEVYEVYEVKEV